MLAMNLSPCRRAASSRLMWPACRLPMVGTNTTRLPAACQRATCARTSAMVVDVSIIPRDSRVEFVLWRGVGFLLDGMYVSPQCVEVGVGSIHEIPHEARLA